MKEKLYTTYILLFTSIIMMIVPVIPHHHHGDDFLCMRNDLPTETPLQHQADQGDCCCNSGCITTHFFEQVPIFHHALLLFSLPNVITLFSETYSPKIDSLSEKEGDLNEYSHLETLHSTYIIRARGFRAPPRFLS